MKIAFVTNLPSHFHKLLFETLARHYDVDFFFYSEGNERWREKRNPLKIGNYRGQFVPGFRLTSRVRINAQLVSKLLARRYDLFIQDLGGRFELPATYMIARFRRKPFVLWTSLSYHPGTLFHRISYPFTKHIYRHSDAIVTYGDHVNKYLAGLGVRQSRLFSSWNVTDNEFCSRTISEKILEELRSKYSLNGRQVILFVGRLSSEKGLNYLFEAYKGLPAELNASLLIVGSGPEEPLLREYVSTNSLGHVHFVGYVSSEDLAPFYAVASVLVLPSITTKHFKEVWGIVLNEALNQGCPVIATTAVGAAAAGLVVEGRNGFVIPERDPRTLLSAIEQLFSDRKKLLQMKEYARQAIKEWDHNKSFKGFQQAIECATSEER